MKSFIDMTIELTPDFGEEAIRGLRKLAESIDELGKKLAEKNRKISELEDKLRKLGQNGG